MQQSLSTSPTLPTAWGSIISFFSDATLPEALQQVHRLVNAACSDKRPHRSSGQLLFVVQQLQGLIEAAFTIHNQQGWHSDAIVVIEGNSLPDIQQPQRYVNELLGGTAWDCFPRHLSSRQYHNPYRVFKKIVHTMSATGWKQLLQDLLEFAVMKATVTDAHPAATILLVQKRLCQLLEACHLLAVRVPRHKAGLAANR